MFNKFTSRSKKTNSNQSTNSNNPTQSRTSENENIKSKRSISLDTKEEESSSTINRTLVTTPSNEIHSTNTSFFNRNSSNTLNINPNFNSSKSSISSKSAITTTTTETNTGIPLSSSSHHQILQQHQSKQINQNHNHNHNHNHNQNHNQNQNQNHNHNHNQNQNSLIQDSIDQESIESHSNQSTQNITPTLNHSNQLPTPSRTSTSTTLLAPSPFSSSSNPTHSPLSTTHQSINAHQINPRKPNKKPSKSSSITSTTSGITTGGIAEALAMSGVTLITQANHLPSPPSIRRSSNPTSTNQSNLILNDSQLLMSLPPNSNPTSVTNSNGFKSPSSTLHHHPSNYDLASEFDDQFLGTGYAVASRKRNFDFHSIFKSIPQDDYLIEDYGCALQRDILVQGRLYISEQHLCFNANIFGWVTTLVLPFSDVVSIEKKMTALIIPNAIQVMTMQSRHTFASFISRDVTYDLMNNIWRISHPTIPTHNNSSNISLNPAIGNDEVHVEYLGPSNTDPNSNLTSNQSTSINSITQKLPESTVCACLGTDAHYKDIALDTTYNTSIENLYNLIFLNDEFMNSFWENDQRLTELETSEWDNNMKKISYIKPLNASMGPKQCKCEIDLQIISLDFLNSITILTTTRTPDVPAGSSFLVLTRTCLMFVPDGCRIVVTTSVEWSKVNRFLKGIIESSALSGQKAYHSDLDNAIRQELKRQESQKVTKNGFINNENERKEGNQRKGSFNEKNPNPNRNQSRKNKLINPINHHQNQNSNILNRFKFINPKNLNITNYLGISIIIILIISNLLTFRNHSILPTNPISLGNLNKDQERKLFREEIKILIKEGMNEWILNFKENEFNEFKEIDLVLNRFENKIKGLKKIVFDYKKESLEEKRKFGSQSENENENENESEKIESESKKSEK